MVSAKTAALQQELRKHQQQSLLVDATIERAASKSISKGKSKGDDPTLAVLRAAAASALVAAASSEKKAASSEQASGVIVVVPPHAGSPEGDEDPLDIPPPSDAETSTPHEDDDDDDDDADDSDDDGAPPPASAVVSPTPARPSPPPARPSVAPSVVPSAAAAATPRRPGTLAHGPPPPAAQTFAEAATKNTMKLYVRPEIRRALKACGGLDVLDDPRQTEVLYGDNASLNAGHAGVRSYTSYRIYADLDAMLEGCSQALRRSIMTASRVVILSRQHCGRDNIVLIKGAAPRANTAGTTAASPFKGWRDRVAFAEVLPAHMDVEVGNLKHYKMDLNLLEPCTISGPTAIVETFLKTHHLARLRPRVFKDETHTCCDLTYDQVKIGQRSGLLIAPLQATATSHLSARMLTVEFSRETDAKGIHAILVKIQNTLKCGAAVTNFRGRLLFETAVSDDMIVVVANFAGVKVVRRPFAATARLGGADEQDTPNEGDPLLPAERPNQPCILVQSMYALLPMNWITALLAKLGSTCKLVSHDGAQALITTTAAAAKEMDGAVINDAMLIYDFGSVLKKRAAADEAMNRSLARQADSQGGHGLEP